MACANPSTRDYFECALQEGSSYSTSSLRVADGQAQEGFRVGREALNAMMYDLYTYIYGWMGC